MKCDRFNPLQWHSAVGLARQICARVFRDGGSPADAVTAFGLTKTHVASWNKAVDLIAEHLCLRDFRSAA